MRSVPFNRPYVGAKANEWVGVALAAGRQSGDGPWSATVVERLQPLVGGGRTYLTPSGTDALELACMAAGFGPGDEVIVPSFTFSSTATAVARQGAVVRFADIDPWTLSINPDTVLPLVNERTRGVIVVHYAGQASRLTELKDTLDAHGIVLIEDAAHSLGGALHGLALGSFGAMSCFSFHETKNLSCGEGGAIVINDEALVEKVEMIREKGTDRSRFFRGQVAKYTWVSPGSSFLLSDILAAVLAAGLDDWSHIQASRARAWALYEAGLSDFAHRSGFTMASPITGNLPTAHLFYLLAPSATARDSFIDHCDAAGVMALSHYEPLADSGEGRRVNEPYVDDCPVSRDVSSRLVRLPLFADISDDDVATVVETVNSFC